MLHIKSYTVLVLTIFGKFKRSANFVARVDLPTHLGPLISIIIGIRSR